LATAAKVLSTAPLAGVQTAEVRSKRQPPGCPSEPAQHPVDAVDQRRLILAVAEDPAHPPAVGQGTDQQVGGLPPGRREVEEVPLDLLSRQVVDLDRRPAPDPGTGLAVRPQLAAPDRLGETGVGPGVPEPADLVPERRRPDVRISRSRSVTYAKYGSSGSGVERRRSPGRRSPRMYARIVFRLRPRCRAMAEIVQPRW
jgi:hypothetical protein